MADNVETLVVAVQVDGEEKLADLAAKADQVTAATNRARDARGRFVGGPGGGGGSSSPEEAIASGAKRAADATNDLADKAEKGGSKVAGFGQSMLQGGRIAQDFAQGGLAGVINNIEQFTQAVGLGPGAAGVLTLLGTAFLVLKPQIKEFGESLKALFGDDVRRYADQVKTLTDRVKELDEKPMRVRVEQVELDQAKAKLAEIKAGLAEVEAQQKRQNVHESESGKLVQEALDESETGAAGIKGKGVAAIRDRDLANSVTIKDARAAQAEATRGILTTEGLIRGETDPNRLIGLKAVLDGERQKKQDAINREDEATKTIGTAAEAEYGNLLRRAREGHGKDQAEAQAQLAGLLGNVGEKGVAGLIAGSSPAAIKRGDADIEAAQDFGDRATRAGAARRARAAREGAERDAAERAARAKKQADGAPMDDAVRAFKGEQDAARARRKADGAPMDDAVRIFKGEQEAKKGAKKATDARQKEAMARAIFNEAGGRLTPDQSRDAAGDAQKSMQQMGQFGRTQMGANQAMYAAMNQQLAAMQQMMMKIEQQAAGFDQLGRGFNQVFSRANQRQATALNFGK